MVLQPAVRIWRGCLIGQPSKQNPEKCSTLKPWAPAQPSLDRLGGGWSPRRDMKSPSLQPRHTPRKLWETPEEFFSIWEIYCCRCVRRSKFSLTTLLLSISSLLLSLIRNPHLYHPFTSPSLRRHCLRSAAASQCTGFFSHCHALAISHSVRVRLWRTPRATPRIAPAAETGPRYARSSGKCGVGFIILSFFPLYFCSLPMCLT